MSTFKRLSAILLSVVLFSGIGLTVPVSAHAIDTDSSSSSSTTQTDSETETADTSSTDDSDNSAKASTMRDQFKALAKQDVANKKAHAKQQSQADRQKACTARKTNLTNRMSNAVRHAQTHKAVFDKIYNKVKAFHDSKGLTVQNYDTLVAAADAGQSDAAASISALQSLDASIDCTSQTVADSVGAFQQAVKATRDSLKTYRADITAVIKALKGASTTNEGSQ